MEIAPVPQRHVPRGRSRLAVALLVLAPVIALVLLPAGLGLDRHLVTDDSMAGSMSRGSLVLARDVPPGDLRVGDVITYRAPHHAGLVTHRIVAIDQGVAWTRGDNAPAIDPWQVQLDAPTYARVLLDVPWVGYPFVANGIVMLVGLSVAALLLALLLTLRPRLRTRHREAARVTLAAASLAKVRVG